MKTLLLIPLVFLFGCASQMTPEQYSHQLALIEKQAELHSKAALEIDCPSGCKVVYRDPNKKLPTFLPAKETNGWDAAISVAKTIGNVATAGAPYWVAQSVSTAAVAAIANTRIGDSTVTTTTHTTTSGDVITSGDVAGDTTTSGDVITSGDVTGDTGDTDVFGDYGSKGNGDGFSSDSSSSVSESTDTNTETTTTTTTDTVTTTTEVAEGSP